MALEKTKRSVAALVHATTYTLPFMCLTTSIPALALICLSHFVIDRWRLARYVCWVKNYLAPEWIDAGQIPTHEPNRVVEYTDGSSEVLDYKMTTLWLRNYPWAECSGTGYHKDRPAWMTVWLMIIMDNTLHIICNGLAIRFLG